MSAAHFNVPNEMLACILRHVVVATRRSVVEAFAVDQPSTTDFNAIVAGGEQLIQRQLLAWRCVSRQFDVVICHLVLKQLHIRRVPTASKDDDDDDDGDEDAPRSVDLPKGGGGWTSLRRLLKFFGPSIEVQSQL